MTSVVTGASGHLGANLVRRLLDDGEHVRVITAEPDHVQPPGLRGLDVERICADIRDDMAMPVALKGAEVVYHLAGKISITKWDEEITRSINVGGTANIVDACLRRNVRRLVHVSSVNAYNPKDGKTAIVEDSEASYDAKLSPYHRTKAVSERIVLDAVERGLDAVVMQPTGMLGPHDYVPSMTGVMLRDIWSGRFIPAVGGGSQWIDVRDVADTLATAATKARSGQRYLLAGTWVSVKDFIGIARAAAGMPDKRTPVIPSVLARVSALGAEAWSRLRQRPPKLSRQALATLGHYRFVIDSRATEELGHSPRPFEDSMRDTYEWALEHWDALVTRS